MTALLADHPFPGEPPRYLRARLYDHTFSTREEKRTKERWWTRELAGECFPVVERINQSTRGHEGIHEDAGKKNRGSISFIQPISPSTR